MRRYTSKAHPNNKDNTNLVDKDIAEKENENDNDIIMDNNELSNQVNHKLEAIKFYTKNVRKNNLNKIVTNKVKVKVLQKEKNDALKNSKGGYYSYNKNICVLGSLQFLLNKANLISTIKDKLLFQLNANDLYSLLVNIQYVSAKDGSLKGTTPMESMIVTGKANSVLIGERIHNGLRKAY